MRLSGKTYRNPFIDTCTISRDRHVYPHKLTDMCDRYDIALTGAHRALNDVMATWELLKAMDAEESVSGYINRLGYLEKYGPPSWSPDYATLVPTTNRYAG
jgi:DNA polymerase-3 subunit epsilon/DNA polymerase-3 subunit alpha (Gram-positive type)